MSFISSYFDFMVLSPVSAVACDVEICPYKYSCTISEGTEQSKTKQNLEELYCFAVDHN